MDSCTWIHLRWSSHLLRIRALLLVVALALLSLPGIGRTESTIFGGGPFYAGGTATMNALRASGYTTVMLWCIHVDGTTGNLIYNDQLVVANGVYVGKASWPSELATLKVAPTSVKRIEISVGSWGVNDFLHIRNLMNTHGTNTTSILYRNFQALKVATGADAVDFDDETLYDVDATVKFGRMLASIGYKVTLCPYTQASFWQNVYAQLGPGIVDAVYLQCYAGGAGNNPATWNNYFGGLKVQPGLWCKNGGGCSAGLTAAEVEAQMTAWKNSAGITGGFMWLYDDMLSCTAGGTAADYARAINRAVDPLQVSPRVGFDGVAAFNESAFPANTVFTLGNPTAAPLPWSLVNTSSWLSVSPASGTISPNGSALVNVVLNTTAATNLPPGRYSANVLFSNSSSGATVLRAFTLNTAVANMPVDVTGQNAGIIAPSSATGANPGATAFDIPNGFCFYQAGLGAARGLPASGLFASRADAYTAFRLGPYGGQNALMLGHTYPRSGTLTLAQPARYNSLAFLASSANGGGNGSIVLNFSNGNRSQAFPLHAQDWFYTVTNVAIQGFGRLRLGTTLTAEDNGDLNPNLYQTTLNLAALGITQSIASITFSNPANAGSQQTTAILAVSGMPMESRLYPPSGLAAWPGSNATLRLTWSGSPGAVRYVIKRSTASGSGFVPVGTTTQTTFTDTGLANGSTYIYVVSAVGHLNDSPDSAEVAGRPGSYLGWLLAGNPIAYWPLNEAAGSEAFEVVQGKHGNSTGGYTRGVNGAIGAGFETPHRATRYDGASGYTQIPRLIGGTNFSIAFWVQTSTTGGTPNWYNGRGLVDGEVGGATTDFGVALVGGRVGFGVGNPDQTLSSVRTINNGAWHQVVVTRDSGNGGMRIYIDGTLDASAGGPTGPRTAPPSLRIGGLQAGGGYLNGAISDVAFYDRVLTPQEVTTLYRAATGLYYDVTITNQFVGGNVVLSWPGNGKLLEAPAPVGPWTQLNATSPAVISPVQTQRFYKVQTVW